MQRVGMVVYERRSKDGGDMICGPLGRKGGDLISDVCMQSEIGGC